jgi:hypothetical protein
LTALYPLCAVMIMLAGGLAGQLRPEPITLALVVMGIVAIFAGRRLVPFTTLDGWSGGLQTNATRIAVGALLAFLSLPLVRVFTAGTGYFIDDLGYHAVAAASWVQHGGFAQIMPQFMAYLPFNAELLSGWFALPFHNDAMVVLAGLTWLILAAVAAGGLVRLSGGDATASLLTATAILASPQLAWQTRTFAAADLAGSATLLAAVYFAASAITQRRVSQAIVAGLLAGFAAGTKATFLPVAALICLWPLFAAMPWQKRWAFAVSTMLAVAATGSIWYLRNWIVAGNPLFPAELGPFPGPLTRGEQAQIKLASLIANVPWTLRLWGNMIYDDLNWPLPLGLLAVAGYLRGMAMELSWVKSPVVGEASLRRLLLIGGLAQFVLHFFAPFCLVGGYVNGRIEVYPRYIMPWFVFGLVLAGPLLDARTRLAMGWRALAAIGLAMCWPLEGFMRFGGVVLALAGVALVEWLPIRWWRPLAFLTLIAIWPLLAVLEPRIQAASEKAMRLRLQTERGKSLWDGLLALESLPAGTHLARFANEFYLNAPFFGRDWQLRPIFTDADGRLLEPYHVRFRACPAQHFMEPDPSLSVNASEFIGNLRAAGISHVFVTKFGGPDWPPQQALLEQSGAATKTFDDGDSTLWSLTTPTR